MHKSWETKCYIVAPNVISIIIAVFYVKNMIISACTLSRTTRMRLTSNSRILCSECGTCFMSPFWHWEFESGSWIFGIEHGAWIHPTDGVYKIMLSYVHYKLFVVKFPDKSEWESRLETDNNRELHITQTDLRQTTALVLCVQLSHKK